MNNQDDLDEDVDVYVSPRRFVGRTPGPKVTRQRVFEDDEARKKKPQHEVTLGIGEVKYISDIKGTCS